jgi:hypothetical protein
MLAKENLEMLRELQMLFCEEEGEIGQEVDGRVITT